jgi:hypothetical protein
MVKKLQIETSHKALTEVSQLSQFTLGFEYDKTLQEVKREVRVRTFQ